VRFEVGLRRVLGRREGFSEIPRSLVQVAAVPMPSFWATAHIVGQSEG
jgi:hypothetical protein